MNRRKKSLTYLLLLPLLLVVLLQGIVPFSILLASGTRETMERNTVDIDSNLVENQSVVLQNAMVDQWSGIRNESNFLTNMLWSFLAEQDISIGTFLGDSALQRAYAAQVFPELLDYLRRASPALRWTAHGPPPSPFRGAVFGRRTISSISPIW